MFIINIARAQLQLARAFPVRYCIRVAAVLAVAVVMPGFAQTQTVPGKVSAVLAWYNGNTAQLHFNPRPSSESIRFYRSRVRVKKPLGEWVLGEDIRRARTDSSVFCGQFNLTADCRAIRGPAVFGKVTYDMQVAAENTSGNSGPWSDITGGSTVEVFGSSKATAPGKPATLTAEVGKTGAIDLIWNAGSGMNTEYRVRWRRVDGNGFWRGWTASTNPASDFRIIGGNDDGISAVSAATSSVMGGEMVSYTLRNSDLTPDVNYEVQVAGVNQASLGAWSDSATAKAGAQSSDATLSAVSVGATPLVLIDDEFTLAHTVSSATTSVVVTPTLNDSGARMRIGGFDLADATQSAPQSLGDPGSVTDIEIVVTAEDETVATYTIEVTRLHATLAKLDALTLSAGTLTPPFNRDRKDYTANVSLTTAMVTVAGRTADAVATVTTSAGNSVGSFSSDETVFLGETVLTVTVTAAAGNAESYTVTVTRAAPAITNFVIGGASVAAGESFSASAGCTPDCMRAAYNLDVPNDSVNLTLGVTLPAGATATIDKVGDAEAAVNLPSGFASGLLPLVLGENVFHLVYTQGAFSTTYVFSATLTANDNATLRELGAGDFRATLADEVFTYALSVPFSLESADITAISADASAAVAIAGDGVMRALSTGVNKVRITVTASDRVAMREYVLEITRQPEISAISISGATLSNAFSPLVPSYTAAAAAISESFIVNATFAADASMTISLRGGMQIALTSGVDSAPIALGVGENTIDMIYTEGGARATYNFIVTRANPTPPSAPQNVALMHADGGFGMTWGAPLTDNGAAVSGYRVRWKFAEANAYLAPQDAAPGALSYRITALENGATYDVQVAAVNSAGTGEYSAPLREVSTSLPQRPGDVIVTTGGLSLNVVWSAPVVAGVSVDAYHLRWKLTTAAEYDAADARTLGGEVASARITGLTAGAEYQVQVRAENIAGAGEYSVAASGTPVELTAPGIPQFPQKNGADFHAIEVTAQSLILHWRAPESDGGGIDHYIIQTKPSSAHDYEDGVQAGASPFTISGLAAGMIYDLQIAAVNAAGAGEYLNFNRIRPGATHAPSAPRNVSATAAAAQISVNWEIPAATRGDPVVAYQVSWKPAQVAEYSAMDTLMTAAADTAAVIQNLAHSAQYDVRVRGLSALDGDYSAPVQATTPAGSTTAVPGKPRNLKLSQIDSGLIATWDAPADTTGGELVMKYHLRWKILGAADDEDPVEIAGNLLRHEITGLSVGETYQAQITAENSQGTGDASDAAQNVVVTTPGIPQNVTATAGALRLLVAWDAPAENGGAAVSGYQLQWKTGGGGYPSANVLSVGADDLTATISGLTQAAHDVQVRALNVAGGGDFATALPVTPAGAGAPDAPRRAVGSAFEFLTILGSRIRWDVSWRAPAFDGGASITKYVIRWKESSAADSQYSALFDADDTDDLTFLIGSNSQNAPIEIGNHYDVQIAAVNTHGAGDYLTYSRLPAAAKAQTPPSAPLNPNARARQSGLMVAWELPALFFAEIMSYEVRWKTADAGGFGAPVAVTNPRSQFIPPQEYIIGDLIHGTEYDVQVRAVNANGGGEYSATAKGIPAGVAVIPSAPQNPNISQSNAGALRINWQAPAMRGGAVIGGYKVRWKIAGGEYGEAVNVGGEMRNYEITNLTAGRYEAQVAAENSAGMSEYSAAAAGEVRAVSPPGIPVFDTTGARLHRVAAGDGSLQISWGAPARDGGLAISGYKVRWKESSANNYEDAVDASAANYTVSGLNNGVKYDVQIAAANASAAGEYLTIARVTPSAAGNSPPSEPRNIRISIGEGSLTARWDNPAFVSSDGDFIVNYEIRRKKSTDTEYDAAVNVANETTAGFVIMHVLGGLENGVQYDVQIRAVDGTGAMSDYSPVMQATPSDLQEPSAPRELRLVTGGETIIAAWKVPADSGDAAIRGYKLRWKLAAAAAFADADMREVGADVFTATITGLANGMRYEIEVAAFNDGGDSTAATADATPALSTDATLSDLTIQDSSLSPAFSANIRAYTAAFASEVGRANLMLQLNYHAATASIDGAPVASGDNYITEISAGENIVNIVVTAEDGNATATYKLTITRLGQFNFDIDDSGAADGDDGIVIARYIAGVQGEDLTSGIDGFIIAADAARAKLFANHDLLNIDGDESVTIADGILIARYLLGVKSGDGLTFGHADMNAEMKIIENIDKLTPP